MITGCSKRMFRSHPPTPEAAERFVPASAAAGSAGTLSDTRTIPGVKRGLARLGRAAEKDRFLNSLSRWKG